LPALPPNGTAFRAFIGFGLNIFNMGHSPFDHRATAHRPAVKGDITGGHWSMMCNEAQHVSVDAQHHDIKVASHRRAALRAIVSNTGWTTVGELAITPNTSDVAVCHANASASSRLNACSASNRRKFSTAVAASHRCASHSCRVSCSTALSSSSTPPALKISGGMTEFNLLQNRHKLCQDSTDPTGPEPSYACR
jgi:hypothetical protein